MVEFMLCLSACTRNIACTLDQRCIVHYSPILSVMPCRTNNFHFDLYLTFHGHMYFVYGVISLHCALASSHQVPSN